MAHRKSKPSDPMTKYGRPIAYDREIVIGICRRLINGEDLQKICTEHGMPIGPVFLGWVQDHKEAREIHRFCAELSVRSEAGERTRCLFACFGE
jgi:hypothetical protein